MTPTHRHFPAQGSHAQQRVLRLVQSAPHDHVHVVDLPYRLSSWAWSHPPQTQLWVTPEREVHAWACLQTPFWSLDFAVHTDAPPTLLREVIAWADAQAESVLATEFGRPMWFAFAFSDQSEVIAVLEEAGFEVQADGPAAWSMVLMRHASGPPPPPTEVPPGFTLRTLRGQSEVRSYVDLHRSVFDSDSMTEAWRAAVLRHPDYDADLDLVVTDAVGDLVGFCIGWFSPTGWDGRPSGQIEPMGVGAHCRGRGLGRALASECVRRLYAKGARDVYVETDSHRDAALSLYEAVGFRVDRSILVFRKDYSATAAASQ